MMEYFADNVNVYLEDRFWSDNKLTKTYKTSKSKVWIIVVGYNQNARKDQGINRVALEFLILMNYCNDEPCKPVWKMGDRS